jgi:RNA polymerase sigma-70 factor (ECF subfamily)
VCGALVGARRGDGEALATIWRAYQPALLRYLRGRGLDDAEDLTSQIWMDAARNLAEFEGGPDELRRWLFTIAHRRVIDQRRRAGRRPSRVLAATDDDLPGPSCVPGADDAYDEHAALERAVTLVATLPDAMREAVLLRVVGDLSVVDVADVMGTTAGNVRVLVHRGLRRLEQHLSAGAPLVSVR